MDTLQPSTVVENVTSPSDYNNRIPEFWPITKFINGTCAVLALAIALANIAGVLVLTRCRRIPFCTRIFSINFLLSDALGSIVYMVCQVLIFCVGINTDLMMNIRTVGVGLTFIITMSFVSGLALDRALSLKASLQYASIVTKFRVIAVAILIWSFNALIFPLLLYFEYRRLCQSKEFCAMWDITKCARIYALVFVVTCQITVTLSYFYVFKIVRAHQRKLEALRSMTFNGTTYKGVVSERQFAATKILLKLVLVFILMHTPLLLHYSITETNVASRHDVSMRLLLAFSYVCMQANSVVSLNIYVIRFKECQLNLLILVEKVYKNYSKRIAELRMEVYNIVVSSENQFTEDVASAPLSSATEVPITSYKKEGGVSNNAYST